MCLLLSRTNRVHEGKKLPISIGTQFWLIETLCDTSWCCGGAPVPMPGVGAVGLTSSRSMTIGSTSGTVSIKMTNGMALPQTPRFPWVLWVRTGRAVQPTLVAPEARRFRSQKGLLSSTSFAGSPAFVWALGSWGCNLFEVFQSLKGISIESVRWGMHPLAGTMVWFNALVPAKTCCSSISTDLHRDIRA